jgi:hypothetical protein
LGVIELFQPTVKVVTMPRIGIIGGLGGGASPFRKSLPVLAEPAGGAGGVQIVHDLVEVLRVELTARAGNFPGRISPKFSPGVDLRFWHGGGAGTDECVDGLMVPKMPSKPRRAMF